MGFLDPIVPNDALDLDGFVISHDRRQPVRVDLGLFVRAKRQGRIGSNLSAVYFGTTGVRHFGYPKH
jgi:hypothetical protein